jgi:hypothetical protein
MRLLAAVFERPQETWFFKLLGPTGQVGSHEAVFRRFVESVRFTDRKDEPVTWELPADWRKGPPVEFGYATFYVGPGEESLRVTVSKLEGRAGSLLANVNRWRRQIGLIELSLFELDAVARPLEVNGVAGTWVDMSGPGASTGGADRG